jgi:hypothetical protein
MDPVSPDENSVATSRFISNGDSGEATITVSSGSAGNVKFSIGLALIDSVSVRASVGSVPATGRMVTARVAATVVQVRRRSRDIQHECGSRRPGEVTDSNGEASTRLTTDANATVTATAGTKSGTVTIQALNPVPHGQSHRHGSHRHVGGQLWTLTATVANNTAVGSLQFDCFGDRTPVLVNNSPSTQHATRRNCGSSTWREGHLRQPRP